MYYQEHIIKWDSDPQRLTQEFMNCLQFEDTVFMYILQVYMLKYNYHM